LFAFPLKRNPCNLHCRRRRHQWRSYILYSVVAHIIVQYTRHSALVRFFVSSLDFHEFKVIIIFRITTKLQLIPISEYVPAYLYGRIIEHIIRLYLLYMCVCVRNITYVCIWITEDGEDGLGVALATLCSPPTSFSSHRSPRRRHC